MSTNPNQATIDELAELAVVFENAAGSIATPAFVYEDAFIVSRCEHLKKVAYQANCKLLYSIKALTLPWILDLIAPYVHGFSASSLFEATTARKILPEEGTIHLTTPGLRPDQVAKISENCDYISFNTVSQWLRHRDDVAESLEIVKGKLDSAKTELQNTMGKAEVLENSRGYEVATWKNSSRNGKTFRTFRMKRRREDDE